ncbi:hypothetical protein PFICI_02604 [Pestalotiopsis fici W106-1]|uniref:Norsolorinic acid ketoreductase n=1 Tax=Pestalotiopsis fici (strain W106-1 / CGMCC3.15140) TaxID=1229662 RepID=W3XEY4_PESFW|nr:uncharacterized protein PFICI_02604 [Pestalotiopsis fici W106-1]ETS84579.1 hypothetical protein PFICI_02604 [Pestalotiopsis fici W106-1]
MPTILITGANQGIGRALTEAYLSRPNHTVIGAVRNPESTTLKDVKPGEGSKLLVVKIEATSETDPAEAVDHIRAAGITALDIVIAVTGINPASAFASVNDINIEALHEIFNVNTFSFVSLFKAVQPLLLTSSNSPKLLALSSSGGQIAEMEPTIPVKVGIYGASKAALNYLVRRVHFENPWLTAWVMNPGFVQSASGNANAKLWGMEQAPHSMELIIPALMAKIDAATRAETSGNFYNFDGTPLTY